MSSSRPQFTALLQLPTCQGFPVRTTFVIPRTQFLSQSCSREREYFRLKKYSPQDGYLINWPFTANRLSKNLNSKFYFPVRLSELLGPSDKMWLLRHSEVFGESQRNNGQGDVCINVFQCFISSNRIEMTAKWPIHDRCKE